MAGVGTIRSPGPWADAVDALLQFIPGPSLSSLAVAVGSSLIVTASRLRGLSAPLLVSELMPPVAALKQCGTEAGELIPQLRHPTMEQFSGTFH